MAGLAAPESDGNLRLEDFHPTFVPVRPEGFERRPKRPKRNASRAVVPALAALLVLVAGAGVWKSGMIEGSAPTKPTQMSVVVQPPAAPAKPPPVAAPPAEASPPPQATASLTPSPAEEAAPSASRPPEPQPTPPAAAVPPPAASAVPVRKQKQAVEERAAREGEAPRKQSSAKRQRDEETASSDSWQRERQAKMDQAFAYGDVVARVQAGLSHLGYYPGPVDGMLTPSTSAAIRAFQRDIGVRATGDIEYGLLAQLQQAKNTSPVSRPRSPYAPHSPYRLNP